MGEPLARFGVAMEPRLLEEIDAVVRERGCTRSELFRDMARAEIVRGKVKKGVPAVATLTIVYDHHVRQLTEKLTDLGHELGDQVSATLHVHLSHDDCLEVIVMRGKSDQLQAVGARILATRGVKHGGMEIVALTPSAASHGHAHPHAHAHAHAAPKAKRAAKR